MFEQFLENERQQPYYQELMTKLKKEYNLSFSKGFVDSIYNRHYYYGFRKFKGELHPHNYTKIITKELFDKVMSWKQLKKIETYDGSVALMSKRQPRIILASSGFLENGKICFYLPLIFYLFFFEYPLFENP